MQLTRRDFIRSSALTTAAAAAGLSLPSSATNLITDSEYTRLKWSKAPCRFCGVGCSVSTLQ